MLHNFGEGKVIPVAFTLEGIEHKGTLTEVYGSRYSWFLHDHFLVDMLTCRKGKWQFQNQELNEQLDYFTDLLIAWYQ